VQLIVQRDMLQYLMQESVVMLSTRSLFVIQSLRQLSAVYRRVTSISGRNDQSVGSVSTSLMCVLVS